MPTDHKNHWCPVQFEVQLPLWLIVLITYAHASRARMCTHARTYTCAHPLSYFWTNTLINSTWRLPLQHRAGWGAALHFGSVSYRRKKNVGCYSGSDGMSFITMKWTHTHHKQCVHLCVCGGRGRGRVCNCQTTQSEIQCEIQQISRSALFFFVLFFYSQLTSAIQLHSYEALHRVLPS